MQPTTIHLVRHGEVYNPKEILYGRLPNYWLSEEGQEQARSTAQYLASLPIVALYSSPMARAQQTASFIGEALELDVIIDERINEIYTNREGDLLADLEQIGFDMYTNAPSEYEQPNDILTRAQSLMTTIRLKFSGKEVVAVTHGDIIVFSYIWAKQAPLRVHEKGRLMEYGLPETYPATASVNSFTFHTNQRDEVPDYQYHRPY